MKGGFLAFRCSNYETTAEREQFRLLCKKMKSKYFNSDHFYLLVANYNIFDSELDAIVIKHDAIVAIEFKNYGGNIVATENGDWTANGIAIKGGSRKTVYQQARINHASLKNGLRDLGINNDWIRNIPTLIVFNQPIILENKLSGIVQSWLKITDNAHFIDKIEDITNNTANLSNMDIIDLAISLNLNSFIVPELSSISFAIEAKIQEEKEQDVQESEVPASQPDIQVTEHYLEREKETAIKQKEITEILKTYDRFTPNHIFALRTNQIFVFGTDKKGSQKYGASGLAAKKFGAQIGVIDGKTGECYALPTKGFSISDLSNAVSRFKDFVDTNMQFSYLVTPVGCGHAGFNASEVAKLFEPFISYENVMLPHLFIEEYISMIMKGGETSTFKSDSSENQEKDTIISLNNNLTSKS